MIVSVLAIYFMNGDDVTRLVQSKGILNDAFHLLIPIQRYKQIDYLKKYKLKQLIQ